MSAIPNKVKSAIETTVTTILAPFAQQDAIDEALKLFFSRVNGKDTTNREPVDKVLTAREVAERLHRSTKTVQLLAARGQLRRIYCGAAGARASGYSEASVAAFLSGRKEVA